MTHPQVNGGFVPCKVDGCGFHTGGTAEGADPPACGEGGSLSQRCLVNFLSADPEDLDWAEYAALDGGRASGG